MSLTVSFLFTPLKQAVQEKFRQAGENLDDLNAWLDKVEREIAGQNILSEDTDSLRSQINSMRVSDTEIHHVKGIF